MNLDVSQIRDLAKQVEQALPSALADAKALAVHLHDCSKNLGAAANAIPDTAEFAPVRAQIALPAAQIELLLAVLDEAPTGRLQILVQELERARKRAGKAG
jgi:hypothetical protein